MFKYLYFILSLPKTLYFNFKYLEFKNAVKLPVFVYYKVLLKELKGELIIQSVLKRGMIKIGFGNVTIFDKRFSRTIWQVGAGRVIFKGNAFIGNGSRIAVGGDLIIGNDFVITAETKIICNKQIEFGENCVLSWETLIMDTDFHKIYNKEGEILNVDAPIHFGNKVWIGCNCTILKGTNIKDNSVIAAGSLLSTTFNDENVIIGGVPGKVLKKGIHWKK